MDRGFCIILIQRYGILDGASGMYESSKRERFGVGVPSDQVPKQGTGDAIATFPSPSMRIKSFLELNAVF
jgi:hypothetical protein